MRDHDADLMDTLGLIVLDEKTMEENEGDNIGGSALGE